MAIYKHSPFPATTVPPKVPVKLWLPPPPSSNEVFKGLFFSICIFIIPHKSDIGRVPSSYIWEMRAAAKRAGTVPGKATHSYKCKKYKLQNTPKGKKGGVDSWRYIKHVARPLPVRNEWL